MLGAYWCRPEAYLDAGVRANCSGLALADPAVVRRGIGRLEADLGQRRVARGVTGTSTNSTQVDLGYRLLVADAR